MAEQASGGGEKNLKKALAKDENWTYRSRYPIYPEVQYGYHDSSRPDAHGGHHSGFEAWDAEAGAEHAGGGEGIGADNSQGLATTMPAATLDASAYARGQQLYAMACVACHGANGVGV